MKSAFLSIAVVALLVALGLAQTPAATPNPDQANIRGCLGGSDGNYTVVEDNTGHLFKITTSSFDLKPHLGHDVALIAHKASGVNPAAADTSFAVTELNMISDHCAAAAAAPAATVTTPAETAAPPAADAAPPAQTASTRAVTDNSSSMSAGTPPSAATPPLPLPAHPRTLPAHLLPPLLNRHHFPGLDPLALDCVCRAANRLWHRVPFLQQVEKTEELGTDGLPQIFPLAAK
jgi:hypothetical protein